MTTHTRADYEHRLQALGICVSARIPVLLWGDPGIGKTAVIESARHGGWHVETLIVSHYEPSDFAGLPVVTDGVASTLAPPGLGAAARAQVDGPSIAFFDEFSTASPALQAAALRPLTHYEVGSLQLPRHGVLRGRRQPGRRRRRRLGARRADGVAVRARRLGPAAGGLRRVHGDRRLAGDAGLRRRDPSTPRRSPRRRCWSAASSAPAAAR